MIKLIQFLIFGCWHQWEIHKEVKVLDTNSRITKKSIEEGEIPIPCGTEYTLRCKHCGNMKIFSTAVKW